jgi:hypothetical protein
MDTYAEQLVARQKTKTDMLKMAGISVGALLIASLLMFLSIAFGIMTLVVPAVLVLFGGVWLMGNQSVEYEYILTNGEMDIDKIIGKRKRKRMITVNVSGAEEFAAYPSEQEVSADVTVHASNGLEQDAYYLVVKHSDYGRVKVIFNPNEHMREAITQELPNALRVRIKHNVK